MSFGLGENNRVRAENISDDWRHFNVLCDGKFYCHMDLGVLGRHNTMNALAVAATSWVMGIPGQKVTDGVKAFHGAGRRMEYKGEYHGAKVYDDYAHHPDELRATLEAVRGMGDHRIVLAFQPHTYTRTKLLMDDFVRELKKADVVVENYRPGVMDKLGLGYDQLKEVNDRIIYAAVSGFGCYGPNSQRPGYDIIAQAVGGLMSISGHPGGEPT